MAEEGTITEILLVVFPLLHLYVPPPEAISVVVSPWQIVKGLVIPGLMVLTITVILVSFVQPFLVTPTV